MKKKVVKYIGIIFLVILALVAIVNIYKWIVCGNQIIKISTSSKACANSDLYVSTVVQDKNVDIETKTKWKLKDSKGKEVKDVKVSYEENNAILSIPDVPGGNYTLEAKVSSKVGKDVIEKPIYISEEKSENVTITLDKGIYKPGDTINYRALLTSKENNEPIVQNVEVSIYDGNENKVYKENANTTEYGIISGSFNLASEVNSGTYKIVVKTENNETTKQFKVNPYVTPKYEVNINYDKDSYLVGETAKINVNAKYFFGEPVAKAKLKIKVNEQSSNNQKDLNNGVQNSEEGAVELETDNEGNATLEYKIEQAISHAQVYNVNVEAVDSSNYYVEKSSTFTAGTDVFEIELLPEYGNLIYGKQNEVYVFTHKADGTPIKAYVTITAKNVNKQIVTDENGIGKFTSNETGVDTVRIKDYSISAQNEQGEEIKKTDHLTIEERNNLISTDKIKYEQGEDIKINLSNADTNSQNIYLFKSDKLLKMINTNSDQTSINLGEQYGLIDIYIPDSQNSDFYKRTIFIKPKKQLNINTNTDKSEYKPGDKISISFDTTDEKDNGVDATLLVSMLDNSILNLANNDLSIDNIKLALQDIQFSDELDAATLYSCIVEDKSEQTIMALLLKQKATNPNISQTTLHNTDEKAKSMSIAIVSSIVLVLTVIIVLSIKFKVLRKVIKHTVNYIVFGAFSYLLAKSVLPLPYSFSGAETFLVIIAVLSLAIYVALLSRISEKMYKTSLSILIGSCLICLIEMLIYMTDFYIEDWILPILLVISVVILICAILYRTGRIKNKWAKKIGKELLYILIFALIFIITSFVVTYIIEFFDLDSDLVLPIVILFVYLLNYPINIIGLKKVIKAKQLHKSDVSFYIVTIFAVIGFIAIISFVIMIYRNAADISNGNQMKDFGMSNSGLDSGINNPSSSSGKGLRPEDITSSPDVAGSAGIAGIGGLDSIFDVFGNIPSNGNAMLQPSSTNKDEGTNVTQTEQVKEVEDNKIRNVFLESMCFIPELISSNGKASTELELSDNITTWTIQTIGNTKDGRIGYGSKNDVKVFKEFFADFELPKNLVETDKVSIPVTIYNYTENPITTTLKIQEADWFQLEKNNIDVSIEPKSTNMVYIPLTILKSGENNKFRVEVNSGDLTDIVEKECTISPKGYKVEKVVSTGRLSEDISEDILVLDDIVENSAKAKVKIYSGSESQAIEVIEKIFKMPTGCFEQISSSLYPNILALKYLQNTKLVDEELQQKAKEYITSGYQKLLTYEVKGESGGYSLYGASPAETVLTAYGLMEITDLSEVYDVDEKVIEEMKSYLYGKQKQNGEFEITGNHIGGANSRDSVSLNAYIIWALSESDAKDGRLAKSINYLKSELNNVEDNYTLALIANVLANVEDKETENVLKRLVNNVNSKGIITSNIVDYYGARGNVQNLQTTALTSMALSKKAYNQDINKQLINNIISQKDVNGTWYSTQATILALKAINQNNEKKKLENQTISVKMNSDEQKIEIKDNPIDIYELTFNNLNKENKLNIDIEKGEAYYEIVEEYYVPYEKVNTTDDNVEIQVQNNNTNLNVNDILDSNIKVINRSHDTISNGMVTISIPQGFVAIEESLSELEAKGIIEKYEINYTEVNIYLREFEDSEVVDLNVKFRASYPVKITGLGVKAYDYYNPEFQGKSMPVEINVNG